ncbi:MAG TPA: hypothetical protein VGX25_19470 [Actinophytocola sp.]|uniref:hypothetical protein n=1 Tax=Actinophytocola sp. TaxID=1872138 RepID=UPI002DDCF952|nr:hypothetical protein [Actinophytocola sp.]HEV2781569.1 hypothetical protein [Actinophytocola sp.]
MTEALELGRGFPAWLLRMFIAGVAGTILGVLVSGGIGGAALVLLALAAVISVAMPASPAPALVVILAAMSVVALGGDPFSARVLVLIPLVHLLHAGCGIAGLLPARARVHPAALLAAGVRFVAIQAGVFGLVGLMALVPTGRTPAALELVAIVGVAAITPIVLWLLSHRPPVRASGPARVGRRSARVAGDTGPPANYAE